MKSKTILSEENRVGKPAFDDRDFTLKFAMSQLLTYHNALVAAEEEIEEGYKQYEHVYWAKDARIEELKSDVKTSVATIVNYKTQNEDYKKIIERLHSENQALIEENAGLKAKNRKVMNSPKKNDLLIYSKEYHCWLSGQYVGTAIYTDDENIGDSFLNEIGENRVEVVMPDQWMFVN